MNKILIINIDQSYRSLYSASAAASLLVDVPDSEITLITSVGTEALDATELFKNIFYLDTSRFFEESKNRSNESTEQEIKKFLGPTRGTHWLKVINISSNPLGALLTFFLKSEEFLGPHFIGEVSELRHSNFSSYLLGEISDGVDEYFHSSYLIQKVLQKDSLFDKPIRGTKGEKELAGRFKSLLTSEGRKEIVLIDTNIKQASSIPGFQFLLNLYVTLKESTTLLPILLCSEPNEESLLIDKLRERCNGEVLLLESDSKGLLGIINNVSIVLTSDLVVKTITDLAQKPSLLLLNNFQIPLSDFSNVEGSCIVLNTTNDQSESVASVNNMVEAILARSTLKTKLEIYQTAFQQTIPSLISYNGKDNFEFTRWMLCSRFLANLQGVAFASMKASIPLYNKALEDERKLIKARFTKLIEEIKHDQHHGALQTILSEIEKEPGILGLGVKFLKFNNDQWQNSDSKIILDKLRTILQSIMDFLEKEENNLLKD